MRANDLTGNLTSALIEWKPHLVNPQFKREGPEITWFNRRRLEGSPDGSVRRFLQMVEARQYTFQVAGDGGIIQIYYQFDMKRRREIEAASLAYYGPVRDDVDQTPDDTEMGESDDVDTEMPPIRSIRWFRVDHAPKDCRGLAHPECHFHLGQFAESRIPLSRVPTPRQFIDLTMRMAYPDLYLEHRLDGNGRPRNLGLMRDINSGAQDIRDIAELLAVAHFAIPVSR